MNRIDHTRESREASRDAAHDAGLRGMSMNQLKSLSPEDRVQLPKGHDIRSRVPCPRGVRPRNVPDPFVLQVCRPWPRSADRHNVEALVSQADELSEDQETKAEVDCRHVGDADPTAQSDRPDPGALFSRKAPVSRSTIPTATRLAVTIGIIGKWIT